MRSLVGPDSPAISGFPNVPKTRKILATAVGTGYQPPVDGWTSKDGRNIRVMFPFDPTVSE